MNDIGKNAFYLLLTGALGYAGWKLYRSREAISDAGSTVVNALNPMSDANLVYRGAGIAAVTPLAMLDAIGSAITGRERVVTMDDSIGTAIYGLLNSASDSGVWPSSSFVQKSTPNGRLLIEYASGGRARVTSAYNPALRQFQRLPAPLVPPAGWEAMPTVPAGTP